MPNRPSGMRALCHDQTLHVGHSVAMLVSFQTSREVRHSLTHLKTLRNQLSLDNNPLDCDIAND